MQIEQTSKGMEHARKQAKKESMDKQAIREKSVLKGQM